MVTAGVPFVGTVGLMVALLWQAPTRVASVGHASATLTAAGASWTVYHGNPLGTGVDTSGVSFSSPTLAWKSPVLDGEVYGEPLESGGRVFVATESDTVYALSANNGSVLWSTHVGTPVPSSSLPCGNISPTVGITGTPVVDEGRGEIFAVADESSGGAISHRLVGLNIFSGAVALNQAIDPAGSTPAAQLQRTGLNLSNGNVIFGLGGNDGDCGSYHGWVIAVPEGGGGQLNYEIDSASGQSRGAVWMGGAAPEVDGGGNIWAAAGNGSATSGSYDFSDSVFELSPALGLKQFFAPSNWASQNANDADLGSTAPAMLGNGTVLQVGKSNTGYLLNQANLGGVGGQIASASVCASSNADGGDAVVGTDVYVPCGQGVELVHTNASPAGVSVGWTAASGASGAPIVAGGLVWSIKGSSLYGINPANGATVQQLSVGGEANHFPTPSVGDGLLLAPSTNQVYAYAGSAGVPGPPTPPPPAPPNSSYWLVASDGGIFAFGNAGFYGSTGAMHLNRPVVGMAATPDVGGYWLVASDGGIFTFGDARFFGSTGAIRLNQPVVGMAATPDGGGYWLVAADGGIFTFGNARYFGSTGAIRLNRPVVGMAATPDGGGYWLVASDGGIFTFGDARFFGSTGAIHLNQPVVGMARTSDGSGYWLDAADGGIFTFGNATFFGSTGAIRLNRPMVGMAATPDGGGYWLVASDGGVFTFGDAQFNGSEGGAVLNRPVVGMAAAH